MIGASREAEILVLRQQLLVLNRRRPHFGCGTFGRLTLLWFAGWFPSLLDGFALRALALPERELFKMIDLT